MKKQDFLNILINIFKFELVKNNNILIEVKYDDTSFKLKKKRFKEANQSLNKLNIEQGYEIYNKKFYEVSITENSNIISSREEPIENQDNTNKLKYILSLPSDAYLLVFLIEYQKISIEENNINRPFFFYRLRNIKRIIGERENLDIFDLLKFVIPKFKTLQIISESEKSKTEFESLVFSYLFNVGYNTDLSYLPNSLTEDLNRSLRIGRMRRSRIEEIDCPKRKYENDLILYYQKGISSDSIDLKYLSFYHILEHFFEKIYNDELINSIKNELTKPSFSYKRNKDVYELIKIVQDKLKYKNDEFQINEPEALLLVLNKFINDFNEIKNELHSYDDKLLNYYKSTEIEFSNGNRVNFDDSREKILKNLRERIYKTRNSIVHSKETEKSKYLPYKHDSILQKEIILMRILAEKIIISSSKEI